MQDSFDFMLTPGAVKSAMAGCKSSDLWKVPRNKIRIMPGFNVRVRNDEFTEQVRLIADSIKANGYMADKPIAGFVARENDENIVYVIDGHTRLEAVDLANAEGAEITDVPVVTKPAGTSMEDLTVALVISNDGRHLTPYETALVCKRLIGYGMDEAEIARRIGKTRAYITNLLLLVSAPRAVTTMVQNGQVSATLAVETVKAHGKDAGDVLHEGLKHAESKGKNKVTGKHLAKPKGNAPTATLEPARPQQHEMATMLVAENNPILSKGLSWIKAHDPQGVACVRLLAHLTDVDIEEIESMIDASSRN